MQNIYSAWLCPLIVWPEGHQNEILVLIGVRVRIFRDLYRPIPYYVLQGLTQNPVDSVWREDVET